MVTHGGRTGRGTTAATPSTTPRCGPLGYAPRIPFADGLAGTVRWYVDHRDWWEPLKQRARARAAR